ncbi:plasmid pRiA4b ORF-3 family protein [Pseudarthrobacter sp. fls2-241-R2A-127]|uniref:plasmid pRiA4b ORF-3 family protein n=1 Tax=Pseudarthrobacter sp. fls2-241-R2A-127 TaxID=3040303 RepID=UPI0025528B4C|nr:plasmid pRiA4b ORF-3 family protein [Pseudarthrobacter sp. fls2-241-R2A-127]
MGESQAGIGLGRDAFLEIRVELVDSDPAIWRQLEIRSTMTLDQVHRVLQTAFDWEDMHLHRFTALEPFVRLRPVDGEIPDDLQWLPKQECLDPDDRAEEDLSLAQLFVLGSGVAFYEYDFGDSWLHRLEMVSQRPADEGAPPARLVDGARRGPLEDSGGLPGYEEVMDALADSSHHDHDEYSAWVADMTGSTEPFDPAFLDIADVNWSLAELF